MLDSSYFWNVKIRINDIYSITHSWYFDEFYSNENLLWNVTAHVISVTSKLHLISNIYCSVNTAYNPRDRMI